jgi:pyruvate/2-oxoglutarate dehydrogenase complex dihydrolipoamide dehydrogenase (E3) component
VNKSFDAIIVGGGQAGPPLAARLAGAGMSVALIERHLLGGTCVNTGCTPTKTLVASAQVAHSARRASDYGITVGSVIVDMPAINARKKKVVPASRIGLETWLGGLPGCTLIYGHARFQSPREVRVGDDVLSADQIFLNVGGRAVIPDFPGVPDVPYLTNTSILELQAVPPHLIVIGGSYVGLEFAQMFRRFGSEVTVIEKGPRLVGHEDEDISEAITDILTREGITIRTDAECIRFRPRRDGVDAVVTCLSGDPEVSGSHVLLAVGRRPNTDDLAVEKAGIDLDHRGYIRVDDQLRTNVAGIWAVGDCNGRGGFTHTAYNDYEIVAANLLGGQPRKVTDRIFCYGLFIDPPLGRVGMTEKDARNHGLSIRIGSRPMSRVSRAIEKGETQGLMKVIVNSQTDEILGAAVLGVGGDEAIHCVLDTMAAKAPYTVLSTAMHIHPTVAELIPTVLGELGPATSAKEAPPHQRVP